MGNFLNFLELLSLTLWMGSVMFLSFVVAPTLFGVLGDTAGKAVRAIFPKYYLLGAVCGIVLAGVQISRGVLWYWGGMIKPSIVLFSLLALIQIYARQVLTPAINASRDAGAGQKARFDALHRRSVMLNGFTMFFLLLYLVWMALRGY